MYPQSVKRAAESDLIVTNHHKLVSLNLSQFRPESVCVIDEAGQFADNARNALTKNLTRQALERLVRSLRGSPQRRGLLGALQRRLENSARAAESDVGSDGIRRRIAHILSECDAMSRYSRSIAGVGSDLKLGKGSWRWNLLPDALLADLQKALNGIVRSADRIASALDEISKSWLYDPVRSERRNQSECDRLANELRRVRRYEHWSKEMKSDVDSIASSYPSDNFVHGFGSWCYDWTVGQIPFAENARNALTKILTRPALARFVRKLRGSPQRRGLLGALQRRLEYSAQAAESDVVSDGIRRRIAHILSECDAMSRYSRSIAGVGSDFKRGKGSWRWNLLPEALLADLQKALNGIVRSADRIASALDEIKQEQAVRSGAK